jgi:CheY-like chemotaxis protein
MDTQTMEHAFELFTQAKRSADRQQGGLGIGLALVKKLVHLHGGQVQAKSAGPGCGSVFSVLLPLCPIEQVDLSPPQAASAPAQALEGLRILLVDDNVDAAQTLAMLLRAFGHECHVAHEGEQALQLAGEIRPQVFILDIGLPGMDGHQLARRLRQAPQSAGARIVALSGYAQPTEQEAALSAGFDQYLVKPVDAQKLLAAIEGRVQQPALS